MADSWVIAVLIGAVLGFLAGLGVGGGNLLVLWLTMISGLNYLTSRGINLLFFIPTAVVATIFRWRQGSLPLKKIWPAILSGCISAVLFTMLSKLMQPQLIQTLFGILLIGTGIRELLYRPRKAR